MARHIKNAVFSETILIGVKLYLYLPYLICICDPFLVAVGLLFDNNKLVVIWVFFFAVLYLIVYF
jgi:hypothetical protein